jgi:hypothetical protein
MKTQEIINIITNLPIVTGHETLNNRVETKIRETAAIIAPILTGKKLRLTNGSTSPSSQRSYARIYLEPINNKSHDSRHKGFSVLRTWEWQTHSKYGPRPISGKRIITFCEQLIHELI